MRINGKDESIIPDLSGKRVAIVAMGNSHAEFTKSSATNGNSSIFADEVWAVNSMGGVIQHDRVFMLDPPSRFLDTQDSGSMTHGMRKWLPTHAGPIYTCVLDDRVPGAVLYPLQEICSQLGTTYFNNTVAFTIAFAMCAKVEKIMMYGVDFSYSDLKHFAEAGRACCEYLLSKAEERGITVEVAMTTTMFDANKPATERFYGYHRLEDPPVVVQDDEDEIIILPLSKAQERLQENRNGDIH
jgi:hypothetical protein|tara:strand:+ start:1192 stop:1917 length:726 start_codon:yes stop_codon:yes gene_type:complete